MSTTTIRLATPLKARLAKVSKRAGLSAHALILDAVERRVEELELDAAFHALGERRWAAFVKDGRSVPFESGMAFLEALARGEKPKRPRARRLTR